jgi:N1221-like protein
MASLWTAKAPAESSILARDDSDVADTGLADVGLPPPLPPTSVPMGRPQLQRNQPQPPPPHQPPPPPAPQQFGNPNDSLSLMQLKKIVTEFPKIDPTSYAFTYADTASFEEEVDEWFSYNDAEYRRLNRAKDTFERRWKKFAGKSWLEAEQEQRDKFVEREVKGLHATDLRRRCKSLQTILHIILGVWDETAGMKPSDVEAETSTSKDKEKEKEAEAPKPKTRATPFQLEHMKLGIALVAKGDGIEVLFHVMESAFQRLW